MRRGGKDAAHDGLAVKEAPQALLAIGIDNLAVLEELFGENIGDEVLAEVRRRVANLLPAGAALRETRHRRLILELLGFHPALIRALFETMQAAAAAEAIATEYGPIAVTLSGGVSFCDRETDGSMALESAALQALHKAMSTGVGSLELARDRRDVLEFRTRLTEAARAAIGGADEDRLTIAFQPIVRSTGGHAISFHECLVRIRQADGTLLAAGAFMPAIERLGLAPLIDRRVLEQTFTTLAAHPNARLSINVFPQTMQDRGWMAVFEQAVARDPTLPERLIVEVTESCSMLDPARTRAFMERLRCHGVSFALDDFGAGHTALHYLRDFRFDILKIDRRFVHGITHGSDNAFIVETMIGIARRFEMMTVAEAVEAPAEARCLAELGIEYFQGFYFGSPSLMLGPTSTPMTTVAAQA